MSDDFGPIAGGIIFDNLRDKNAIVMAANIRFVPGITKGIFRAAKDANAPLLIESAKSECNLNGGYIGHTPKTFADAIINTANEVGFKNWGLHADHIGVKKGDEKEIEDVKKLILAQIEAGFTSFAIDASHIFNFEGKTTLEELSGNLKATKELADFIDTECKKRGLENYGLEVEVGEIGRKDDGGLVVTTVDEAVTFLRELNKQNVFPHAIAIANGSAHGNIYKDGVQVKQVSIDIPQTKKIADALKKEGFNTRIAQHGITGTPLELIASLFPKGDIIKGNVGTHWQNVVYDVLKVFEPELYNKMRAWVLENHSIEGKSDEEIFGKGAKFALKEFFDELHNISNETKYAMESKAYSDALMFFRAFGTK